MRVVSTARARSSRAKAAGRPQSRPSMSLGERNLSRRRRLTLRFFAWTTCACSLAWKTKTVSRVTCSQSFPSWSTNRDPAKMLDASLHAAGKGLNRLPTPARTRADPAAPPEPVRHRGRDALVTKHERWILKGARTLTSEIWTNGSHAKRCTQTCRTLSWRGTMRLSRKTSAWSFP